MLLLKPSYQILTPLNPAEMLCRIEAAGRTCYKSEDRITEGSAEKFVRAILQRGHDSVIEHESLSVRFICDRGVTHEIVRHRIASYSQESTRYVNYAKAGHCQFIIPPWVDIDAGEITLDAVDTDSPAFYWTMAMLDAERHYNTLSRSGWKPEQARSVLPNSLKTEIVMTANLREWRHFFRLRTARAAHPQIRELVTPLLVELQTLLPAIFDSIKVE